MNQPNQPTAPGAAQSPEVDDLEEVSKEDLIIKWYAEYKDKPYKELAARMVELKKAAAVAKLNETLANEEFDVIRLRVVPERFEKDELTSLRIAGIGRLGIATDAYCTIIPGCKPDLLEWLKKDPENALLVKEDINPSTLKSLVKGMETEAANVEVDFEAQLEGTAEKTEFDLVKQFVNYTPFKRASVTKG